LHGALVKHDHSIIFICMGNICRSPTAEAVFRHKVQVAGFAERIAIDSAGTHNYHPGQPPDARSQHYAKLRGYDLSDLRARALRDADIQRFDWLIVMDDLNYSTVLKRMANEHHHKVRRFAGFCTAHPSREVPDPYYGEAADFNHVLDLVEDASEGLLEQIRNRLALS
jgi:protein-tyrosine phosphatase